MQISPFQDYLLIEKIEPSEVTTEAGLTVVADSKTGNTISCAKVIAVGPGRTSEEGVFVQTQAQDLLDKQILYKTGTEEVYISGSYEVVLIKAKNVIAGFDL